MENVHVHQAKNHLIVIVGAGLAGLAAAFNLYKNGFKNILIFEAQNRIGGRVHTIPFGICYSRIFYLVLYINYLILENRFLELGAQWLHGEKGNPLYELAKKKNLISNPTIDYGIEGDGIFCTEKGEKLDNEIVKKAISHLNMIKQTISDDKFIKTNSVSKVSAGEIFKNQFEKYVSQQTDCVINQQLFWAIFDWYMRFEIIDNACGDLNNLSLKAYTEWFDCDGVSLVNLKSGYQSLIDYFLNELPQHFFQLNKPIENIEIKVPNVILKIKNRDTIVIAQHVIVTSSLGYLKKNYQTFFTPNLPENKVKLIKELGYGTINKLFLVFDTPFWNQHDIGFQLIWSEKKSHQFPSWVYDISGFDVVRGQSNVLLGWIGSKGAEQIEAVESDKLIGTICADVLRQFLPNFKIDDPIKVIRSKWFSNEYICGAYSHRSVDYEKAQIDITELSEPIYSHDNCPRILFAGEATDKEFYSATHGAFRSGCREAQRLIDFWSGNKSYYKSKM